MTEISGYSVMIARLESAGLDHEGFRKLKAEFNSLQTVTPTSDIPSSDHGFFSRLTQIRGTIHRWAHFFNEILRNTRPRDYRYRSRQDLELPLHSPTFEDIRKFMEKYGFVHTRDKGHSDAIFRHPSGVVQKIPYDFSGGGYKSRNFRWYAIRKVEEALRKSGQMAPATAPELDEPDAA
jgi:hypothetical protein